MPITLSSARNAAVKRRRDAAEAVTATRRVEALEEARAAMAEWLDVLPDSFDVEGG